VMDSPEYKQSYSTECKWKTLIHHRCLQGNDILINIMLRFFPKLQYIDQFLG